MDTFEAYCERKLEFVKGEHQLPSRVNKILVIQLGDIGDIVLSGPTLQSLKRNYPSALIYVAARDKASELIPLCPWADGVINIQKEKRGPLKTAMHHWRFFRKLRLQRFDMVFDMRTGSRGALLGFLSGAKVRVGFRALDDTWRNAFFTHLVYPPMDMPNLHMAHYHLLLLSTYGLNVEPTWPVLSIDNELKKKTTELLLSHQVSPQVPLVAIQPFSLWAYKEWAAHKFVELATWIQSTYGYEIVFCGNKSERERIHKMLSDTLNPNFHNLAGKTSIAEYASLLNRCNLFIGCDSAGVHIAAAVNTATASIFGPSSPVSWAPRGPQHKVVQKTMDCVPCRRKGCNNTGFCSCLDDLSISEVIEKITPLLSACKPKCWA